MLRTKVVCTLGPATSSPQAIRALVQAGMDLARVNMSHGAHETHAASIEHVRAAAKEAGRPVAILADLAGPKIRVGTLAEPIELTVGSVVVVAPEAGVRAGEIPTTYAPLASEIRAGDVVLMDDGLLELRCVGTSADRTRLEVVRGGTLKSRKGINLPTVDVKAPSLTEKDLNDLAFALEHDVEYVGLSFVRRPEDVVELKRRVEKRALVVSKIEKIQALDAIEAVMQETDAVMVARGDLGVEMPFERVPLAQKRIIQLANFYARPVITATQMLESMIEHPRPTRAEASDVANAILDGTDAVMLSGETASGAYPLEAVQAMVRIGTEVEEHGFLERGPRYLTRPGARMGATPREHAIAAATVDSARQMKAPAIIVITRSGFSARLVSSYRPPVPVFAITRDELTYRQLAAVWGVHPELAQVDEVTYESLTMFGRERVLASGVGRRGAPIVVTAGYPFHVAGATNTMRIELL